MAESAQALITANDYSWYGCLRATGRTRVLPILPGYYDPEVSPLLLTHVALAGRFAALSFLYINKDEQCSFLETYALATGAVVSSSVAGCALNAELYVALPRIVSLAVDSRGFTAWKVDQPIRPFESMTGVSCPTARFCAAVDAAGRILVSTRPWLGREAWRQRFRFIYAGGLTGVSCPDPGLCVVTGGADVVSSTNPAGPPGSWHVARIDGVSIPNGVGESSLAQLDAVSCSTRVFCVALDDANNAFASTAPAGGASTWTQTLTDPTTVGATATVSISCPAVSLCVGVDVFGNLVTSIDPADRIPSWSVARLGTDDLTGVSCPSVTLCVAVALGGRVWIGTDPSGGPSAWRALRISGDAGSLLQGVSCASSSLCIAYGLSGLALISTSPATGPWHEVQLGLVGVSCPSLRLCVGIDNFGHTVTSTDPNGGASAWTRTLVDAPTCAARTRCITERLYAHDTIGTRILDTTKPGNGNKITHLEMSANLPTARWTHNGIARHAQLR